MNFSSYQNPSKLILNQFLSTKIILFFEYIDLKLISVLEGYIFFDLDQFYSELKWIQFDSFFVSVGVSFLLVWVSPLHYSAGYFVSFRCHSLDFA